MEDQITFTCSYQDCTEEIGLRKQTCPLCGRNYCNNHAFAENHDCEKLTEQNIPSREELLKE